mgnify:CR=1 FL=1
MNINSIINQFIKTNASAYAKASEVFKTIESQDFEGTLAEAGIPGYAIPETLFGFFGPAGLPRPIVERLNGAIVHAAQAQDVREKLESQGMEVVASGSGPYNDWVRTEVNKWRPLIQALKIQAE